MAQRPGFDFSKLSTATKILLVAGLLFFIDLFLPWNRLCVFTVCLSASGWHGWGILAGILVIGILVMEIMVVANVDVQIGTPQMRFQTEAILAGGVLLFTIIKILVDRHFIHFWAWIGLVLAAIIAYGGYMRWQESTIPSSSGPPPATGGGGFSP
jgi:hypothetical protein